MMVAGHTWLEIKASETSPYRKHWSTHDELERPLSWVQLAIATLWAWYSMLHVFVYIVFATVFAEHIAPADPADSASHGIHG